MSDGSEAVLTEAALGALDAFSALLMKSDLGLPQRRSIVQIAWDTCREGDALLSEDVGASLSASEIALAELGAIAIAAAIEAQVAGHRRSVGVSQVPRNVAPWEWIRWRVDACARAARTAGVEEDKCESLRNIGATLLEPYRLHFERIEQKELAALQRHQAEQQKQKEQEEKRQLQQQRIKELQTLTRSNADPEMRDALELEMKELQSQVASGIAPLGEFDTGSGSTLSRPAAGAADFSQPGEEATHKEVEGVRDVKEPGFSHSTHSQARRQGPEKVGKGSESGASGDPDMPASVDDETAVEKVQAQQVEDEKVKSQTTPDEKVTGETTEDEKVKSQKAEDEKMTGETTVDENVMGQKAEDEKVKTQTTEGEKPEVVKSKKPETGEPNDERTKDLHEAQGETKKSTEVKVADESVPSPKGTDPAEKSPTQTSKVEEEQSVTKERPEGQKKEDPKLPSDSKKDVEVDKSSHTAAKGPMGPKGSKGAASPTEPEPERSEVAKVLWVEPSGKSGAEAVWMGPLSAREVLHMAEERTLGPDGLVCGMAPGETKGPPADGKGAQPLWQCLPELGQQLRRASEVQLQQQLEKRFKTMPKQEDATDVLPP